MICSIVPINFYHALRVFLYLGFTKFLFRYQPKEAGPYETTCICKEKNRMQMQTSKPWQRRVRARYLTTELSLLSRVRQIIRGICQKRL